MAKTKHRPDASEQIDAYIDALPVWSKKLCLQLRELILKSDPKIIEDWKWGPNYYKNGMLCGFAAFQKHVNVVFFKGVLMKDKKKLFSPESAGNVQIRYIKLKEKDKIDEEVMLTYLFEAIEHNEKGAKPPVKDKTVIIPPDVKKALKAAGVLNYFEAENYSRRKEWVRWIEFAKREETRFSRIERVVEKLAENRKLV
ncbi:MAG: YdeI/OmpD-associated family protein [Bacteroidia bacterium]